MTVHRQVYFGTLGCAAAIVSLFAAPKPAFATPTKDQCIDANTQAQNFKRDGKLLSARQALRSCADQACPKLVQTDCTRRLDELELAFPSVTFDVKDGAGRDLSAVSVTIDDKRSSTIWTAHPSKSIRALTSSASRLRISRPSRGAS